MMRFLSRRDGKSLERFLEDYFAGRLKRYVKSQPVPANNDGPIKVRMCVGYFPEVYKKWNNYSDFI